ncbi:MAG: hypothetical protein CMH54_01520 [Myxococcales bacterium]|nr:hypothetical protein [Myxococcales bacterium]
MRVPTLEHGGDCVKIGLQQIERMWKKSDENFGNICQKSGSGFQSGHDQFISRVITPLGDYGTSPGFFMPGPGTVNEL